MKAWEVVEASFLIHVMWWDKRRWDTPDYTRAECGLRGVFQFSHVTNKTVRPTCRRCVEACAKRFTGSYTGLAAKELLRGWKC